MSEPTSIQSHRSRVLAAEITLAAMCAADVGCPGCERERQYATHSWVMTRRRSQKKKKKKKKKRGEVSATGWHILRQAAKDHACRLPAGDLRAVGGLAAE